MDSRRNAQRRRALKQAKVLLSDWTVLDCLVRDLSEEGARLEFASPVELPDSFRVQLMSDGSRRPVEVMWRRGQSVGIRFAGPPEKAKPAKV